MFGVLSSEQIAEAQSLWEDAPELSATAIGNKFGVSKGVIIGHADRRKWEPRRPKYDPIPKTTMAERLDALNAMMDRVLLETSAVQKWLK